MQIFDRTFLSQFKYRKMFRAFWKIKISINSYYKYHQPYSSIVIIYKYKENEDTEDIDVVVFVKRVTPFANNEGVNVFL